jgi:hypothetical protein
MPSIDVTLHFTAEEFSKFTEGINAAFKDNPEIMGLIAKEASKVARRAKPKKK